MSDHVLRVLPAIYDAAIKPERWRSALDASLPVVGAKSGLLSVSELQGPEPFALNHLSSAFLTPAGRRHAQYYMEHLVHWEAEAWMWLRKQPKQKITPDVDLWPDLDELRSRADCRFLEEKFGIFRRATVRLNDNRCWFDSLSLQYAATSTTIPEGSLETVQLLLPHFAKAIELGRAFSILRSRYQAVLTALDHVQIGMCIALGQGDVIVANCEAERIFDLDDGIKLAKDQTFVCRDPDVSRALAKAVQVATDTSGGVGDAAEIIMAIQRRSDAQPFLIEVSPLRDHACELQTGLEGALVTVIDPENASPFSTAMVADAYGLTPAESEVCRHLVDGWTNGRIAEERRVSIDTVKTQIASILQKTITKRRSELIRLVLKSSPPIAIPEVRA